MIVDVMKINRLRLFLSSLFVALLFMGCDLAPPTPEARFGDGADGKSLKAKDKDGDSNSDDAKRAKRDGETDEEFAARQKAAKDFYGSTVLPLFKDPEQCGECHAQPRDNPPMPGPLSIHDYGLAKAMLFDGPSSTNNKLLNKARSVETHGGGDQCGDFKVSDCKYITEWYEMEKGGSGDKGAGNLVGKIESFSFDGTLKGYAADAIDPDATLDVQFFIDGDKDNGTAIDAQVADRSGYAGGIQGLHVFNFTLPNIHRDGKSHKIYGYGVIGGKLYEMAGSPYDYTAWTPKGAGNFYNGSVNGSLGACKGCHNPGYSDLGTLASPSPANGGTATNNVYYQKAIGGMNHSGGNTCGGPCQAALQGWWNDEFGN